ncbi:MAG: hypothetical protein FWG85_05175 [Bacteroidetes bacterium]|nr:hypothetical protein [Bacteroidota bacterium]
MSLSEKSLEKSISDIWSVAGKVANQIDASNKKYSELQTRFNFLDNAIIRKNEEIKSLQNQIKTNNDAINEKNNKITEQYAAIELLERKNKKTLELEENYLKSINENTSLKLEIENIGKSNLELDVLKIEYSELLTKYDLLQLDYDNISNKLKTTLATQKDLDIAKKELVNSKYEIISRNEKIDALKISLAEAQSTHINQQNQIKQLQSSNNQSKNEIGLLQNENNLLKQKIEQIEESKNIMLLDYVAILENLRGEISYFDKIKLNNENIISDLEEQLLTKNKNNASEINALKEQIITLTNANENYSNKIQELTQQLLTETKIIPKEDNDNAELVAQNNQLIDIIAKLKDELDINKTGLEHLIKENKKMQIEIDNYKKDDSKLPKISKVIDELKSSKKQLEKENKALKDELISYKKRIYDEDSLFIDINKIDENEINKLKEDNNLLQENNILLQEKNDSLQNEINKLLKEKQAENKNKINAQKSEIIDKIGVFLEKLEKKV